MPSMLWVLLGSLALQLFCAFSAGQEIDPVDQNALVALWNGFSSKGFVTWNTAEDLCGQYGVTCTTGKVTKLNIEQSSVQGSISTEIGELLGLTFLNLAKNSLSGTIPTQIGALASLTFLSLDSNKLSGPIPTELGELVSMRDMNLWGNNLNGTIPTQMGALSNLGFLHLFTNSLSGTIPTQVGALENLKQLELQNNFLFGTVPTELASRPRELLRLDGTNHFCPLVDYSSWVTVAHDFSGSTNCQACPSFNPCANGGTCQGGANDFFSCLCPPQWTGQTCEEDIDECAAGTHTCQQDSYCNNTIGSFSCPCLPGFSSNGASCVAVCRDKFERTTIWPQTFVGTAASVVCTSPSHGVFQGSLANFTLRAARQCLPRNDSREAEWSDEMTACEPTCTLQGCQNGGTCLPSPSFAVCQCPPGYQGKFCDDDGSQRCPDIPCVHGACVNPPDVNLPGYCDCTGTGYNGSLCQIDVDDCLSQPCQNQGTCTDAGPNRFFCECPVGFDGLRCQLCKDDICQNGGRCNIEGSGVLACDCAGTGYGGTFCATPAEGDCRPTPCQNGGECQWSNDREDLKLCSCPSGYRGDFCQAEEYRSLSDPNIVFFVLAPIAGLFLLIVAYLSIINRNVIRSNKKAWLALFGHVFMSCIGIFDLFTDCFFVIQCYDLMVNEPPKSYLFFASLGSLVASFLTSAGLTLFVLSQWSSSAASEKVRTALPFGFFLAFALLANDGIGIFHIVADYLFLSQQLEIKASSLGPCLLGFFFSKAFLEDLPQLVIQGMYQSQIGRATATTVFSLASSALSIFLALVLFFVSEDFRETRNWMRRRPAIEDRTASPHPGPARKKDLELATVSTTQDFTA